MKQFLKTFLYTFLFVTLLLGGAGLYAWKRATGFLDAPIAAEGGKKRVTIEKGASVEQTVILLEIPGLELAVTNT